MVICGIVCPFGVWCGRCPLRLSLCPTRQPVSMKIVRPPATFLRAVGVDRCGPHTSTFFPNDKEGHEHQCTTHYQNAPRGSGEQKAADDSKRYSYSKQH